MSETEKTNKTPTDMQQVQEKLIDLTKQYEAAQLALKELQRKQEGVAAVSEKPKVVVLPRERRLRKFTGKRTEAEQSVEDFTDEIVAVFNAREMTNGEKADFITSHLEGPAKEEIRLYPSKDRSNPQRLLEILQEAFGEKRSLPQLLKAFYDRRQKEGESLREFSHGLRELLNRALKVDKKAVVEEDRTLRDQFANNVRDTLLRKELRRFVREHHTTSFLDVREEALRWTEEEDKPGKTAHHEATGAIPSQKEAQCNAATAPTPDPVIQQMLDVLLKQQKSIEDLANSVKNLQVRPSPTYQGGRNWPRGPRPDIRCYSCGGPNHIARECRNKPTSDRLAAKPIAELTKEKQEN